MWLTILHLFLKLLSSDSRATSVKAETTMLPFLAACLEDKYSSSLNDLSPAGILLFLWQNRDEIMELLGRLVEIFKGFNQVPVVTTSADGSDPVEVELKEVIALCQG